MTHMTASYMSPCNAWTVTRVRVKHLPILFTLLKTKLVVLPTNLDLLSNLLGKLILGFCLYI